MKVKTSVTLPGTLGATAKRHRDARDAAILNGNAERLNHEAAEVLEYQDFVE